MTEHLPARLKSRTNGLFFCDQIPVQRIEQAVGSLPEPKSGVSVFGEREIRCCAVLEVLAHLRRIAGKKKMIESMHPVFGLPPLAGSLLVGTSSKQSDDQKIKKNTVSGQEMQFNFG